MLCEKYNFIFIEIPKTGTTSVSKCLADAMNKELRQLKHNERGLYAKHSYLKKYHQAFEPDVFDKYLKFSIVRNPWDKLVSQYNYNKSRAEKWCNKPAWKDKKYLHIFLNVSFEQWIKNKTHRPKQSFYNNPWCRMSQVSWLTDLNGNVAMDFIGRFENLRSAYDTMCEMINQDTWSKYSLVCPELVHFNASNHKHYTEYYDQEMIDIVADVMKKDLNYFNFDFV